MLAYKIRKIETNYAQQLKNLKPVVFKEAAEFVKDRTSEILKSLSKQHRLVVQQLIDYRTETEGLINERSFIH